MDTDEANTAPPAAPQIFVERTARAPANEQGQPSVLNVDPDDSTDDATARGLAAVFERAQEAADEQVYVEGVGWVAA